MKDNFHFLWKLPKSNSPHADGGPCSRQRTIDRDMSKKMSAHVSTVEIIYAKAVRLVVSVGILTGLQCCTHNFLL